MPDIYNIDAFVIRGAYTPGSPRTEIDYNQFNGQTASASDDRISYNFLDGDNNGRLSDSDRDSSRSDNDDRIEYDGVEKSTISIIRATIKITYKDGNTYRSGDGEVRLFALDNGDLVINPLDRMRNDSNLEPTFNWDTIEITEPMSHRSNTTMRAQDDPIPCFTRDTMIETQNGPCPVQNLQAGDMVLTRDNGFKPILWIGSSKVSSARLDNAAHIRPIRIRAGALGLGAPETDLIVSPQHRVLVRSKIAQRMVGADEVLVAAKHLLEADGVEVAEDIREVEYFHFLFDRHEIVYSNGAETESLYTGAEALKAVNPEALEEIFELFPELRSEGAAVSSPSARPFIKGRIGRQLAHRHVKNQRQFVA